MCAACLTQKSEVKAIPFEAEKWQQKVGEEYPYRLQMLDDLVAHDSIRSLDKASMLALLGPPSYYREDSNYLHYRINETHVGAMSLRTRTLVIKYADEQNLDWMKIHE